MNIIPATPAHAPLIGKAVVMAIGDELARELAGEHHTPAEVEALFADLAGRDDTQYSYCNTLAAVDDEGRVMGLLVCYDGAGLITMRRIFFKEAAERIGMTVDGNVDDIPGETTPDEFYLDSLAVFPEFRGQGIAGKLISAAVERAALSGKRPGLLVDKTNHRARKLYDSLGFKVVGERPFAGETMYHMVLE